MSKSKQRRVRVTQVLPSETSQVLNSYPLVGVETLAESSRGRKPGKLFRTGAVERWLCSRLLAYALLARLSCMLPAESSTCAHMRTGMLVWLGFRLAKDPKQMFVHVSHKAPNSFKKFEI